MNYSYIILIIILLFISIINLFIVSLQKYYIDYYLSYEKTCETYIPELMSFKYNIINYYLNINNTNNQKTFRYSNLAIVAIISLIFFATIRTKEPIHFISLLILIFLIIFMICYVYVDEIYSKNNNIIVDYNNYYKQYNAIVKYAYEKNKNGNFIDEYVYRKNVERYESDDILKPMDINLILKQRYDNNDFMKYFILNNTDNYFNNLNIDIFNYIDKLQIFNDNIVSGNYANIFKDNKIDISNLKPEYSEYLLEVNYSVSDKNNTPISLVDQDSKIDMNVINSIIVNKNNDNNYYLTTKINDHDSDFDDDSSVIYSLLGKLYKTYIDHYDVFQDYLFYKKISLNNISINVSEYDYIKNITNNNKENLHNYLFTDYIDGKIQYYIKIVDIYTITETRKINTLNETNIAFISQLYNEIKLSHSSLSDGIKSLYEITNYMYSERLKTYFLNITNIISIYIALFIFIFALIIKFISNYFL